MSPPATAAPPESGHLPLGSPVPPPSPRGGGWARVLAAIYDPFFAAAERAGLRARRAALLARAEGRVLEVGAGTGLNLHHYPPGLAELALTEPEPSMAARLRARRDSSAARCHVVEAAAEALPYPDASFDTAVCTFALCTVADPRAALAELARVLRPGGRLLALEHVRAESPARARWQRRLAAPWRAFACGCRCDQDTLALVRAAPGLRIETVEPFAMRRMPAIVRPALEIVARRA